MRGLKLTGRGLAGVLIALAMPAAAEATLDQATMVRDPATASSLDPDLMIPFGSGVLFVGQTPATGDELWFSNGTAAGTLMVKDIQPGGSDGLSTGGGGPRPGFTQIGGTVFFAADGDPLGDFELWKTDGTAAGTVLVQDIHPAGDSEPQQLTAVANTLFFSANDGVNGTELWRSDGTSAGTAIVANINPAGSSDPSELAAIGNELYFRANDGSGQEPWRSDGTSAGTIQVADIQPGPASSQPRQFTALGNDVLFSALREPGNSELWITRGIPATTALVTEIRPGTGAGDGSNLAGLTPFGSRIFFAADDGTTGQELWSSDGTAAGTSRVADVNPGANDGVEVLNGRLVPFDGKLFFQGADSGGPAAENWELWKTDGTGPGTSLAAEINPGPQHSTTSPQQLTPIGNSLFLAASDNDAIPFDNELWRSDGTQAGTSRVADIHPSDGAFPDKLTAVGDVLFFEASDGVHGSELWLVDTAAPVATISGGPAEGEHTADSTPSFALTSPAPDLASFECTFDAASFLVPCDAGTVAARRTAATSAPLRDGPQSFAARGVDLRGHGGPMVIRSFVVDTTAPRLGLSGRTLRLNERGRARLRVRCPTSERTGPCTGRLKVASRRRLRSGDERRKLKFRARRFDIDAGRSRRLGLRLSASSLALLGDRDRVAMVAKARASDALGNRGRVSRRLELRAPSR